MPAFIRTLAFPRRAAHFLACALCLCIAACATRAPAPSPPPAPAPAPAPPEVTRGEFTVEAGKLDTWNAVGQILVNTPGVEYQGRSQMLDLYTVRYHGEQFLVLTKALLLSDEIRRTTTRVTATTPAGAPVDSEAVAALLAHLQRELPAEIERVRARQAAEAAEKRAKAKAKAKPKPKKAKGKAKR